MNSFIIGFLEKNITYMWSLQDRGVGILLLIPFHILRDGFKEEINDPTLLSLAPWVWPSSYRICFYMGQWIDGSTTRNSWWWQFTWYCSRVGCPEVWAISSKVSMEKATPWASVYFDKYCCLLKASWLLLETIILWVQHLDMCSTLESMRACIKREHKLHWTRFLGYAHFKSIFPQVSCMVFTAMLQGQESMCLEFCSNKCLHHVSWEVVLWAGKTIIPCLKVWMRQVMICRKGVESGLAFPAWSQQAMFGCCKEAHWIWQWVQCDKMGSSQFKSSCIWAMD